MNIRWQHNIFGRHEWGVCRIFLENLRLTFRINNQTFSIVIIFWLLQGLAIEKIWLSYLVVIEICFGDHKVWRLNFFGCHKVW
jgi:hypothetical protein